jgi:hypothetical protein
MQFISSLDDDESKTNSCEINTYKEFDTIDNREVYWCDNGRYGPNMYYIVPIRNTFADAASHNECILGPHTPPLVETVVSTVTNTQLCVKSYHHVDGSHDDIHDKITTKHNNQHCKNKSRIHKTHKSRKKKDMNPPGELDPYYYQTYMYGSSECDYYYHNEYIGYDECWNTYDYDEGSEYGDYYDHDEYNTNDEFIEYDYNTRDYNVWM